MLSQSRLRLIDAIRLTAPKAHSHVYEDIAHLRAELEHPLRVGVARIDGIGDWLLTLPLVLALQGSDHVDSVTLLSSPVHRPLLAKREGVGFEAIDLWAAHHTPWPHGSLGKILAISALGQRRAYRMGRLFKGRFDLLVLPRWDTDRGQNLRFFAAGVGVPVAGHDPSLQPQASPKERREGRLLSIIARDDREHAHESERVATMVEALGLPLPLDDGGTRAFFGLKKVRDSRPGPRRVFIHTSAHDDFRQWPLESWMQLIRSLLHVEGVEIVLVGGPGDWSAHQPLVAVNPTRVRSVAGEVGLDSLPAQVDEAALFIGNDSGPAHIAATLGVPTLVISCFPERDDPGHPNSPERFGVRSTGGSAVLRPPAQSAAFDTLDREGRRLMMRRVTPHAVEEAAYELTAWGVTQ